MMTEVSCLKLKIIILERQIVRLERLLALYGKQSDERIADLKKRSEETNKKLRELL